MPRDNDSPHRRFLRRIGAPLPRRSASPRAVGPRGPVPLAQIDRTLRRARRAVNRPLPGVDEQEETDRESDVTAVDPIDQALSQVQPFDPGEEAEFAPGEPPEEDDEYLPSPEVPQPVGNQSPDYRPNFVPQSPGPEYDYEEEPEDVQQLLREAQEIDMDEIIDWAAEDFRDEREFREFMEGAFDDEPAPAVEPQNVAPLVNVAPVDANPGSPSTMCPDYPGDSSGTWQIFKRRVVYAGFCRMFHQHAPQLVTDQRVVAFSKEILYRLEALTGGPPLPGPAH
ncbi:hypothetical protein K4K59_012011 [Colletotrichum sp. SAR11_240]|nr:hypothetical protein K4K59_012011 [Colletotrichum sp. SAR11_240]